MIRVELKGCYDAAVYTEECFGWCGYARQFFCGLPVIQHDVRFCESKQQAIEQLKEKVKAYERTRRT